MTATMAAGGLATHTLLGDPRDWRKPPCNFVVTIEFPPYGKFRIRVIGNLVSTSNRMRIDLAQCLDPGLSINDARVWDSLRPVIYDALQEQHGYTGHGLLRHMVDLIP